MLATIVGSANGRSISALTIFLPRKSSRTSTQAIRVPITTLTTATTSDTPTVTRSAAIAVGASIASMKPPMPFSNALVVIAASGSSTIRLSQSVATPSPRGPIPPAARRPSCPLRAGRGFAAVVVGAAIGG